MSVKVSGNLLANNAPTLRAAAIDGRGIIMAPTFIGIPDLQAGVLVPLLPDHRAINFVINASYPTRRHLSTKVRAFLDLAAEHFVRHRAEIDPN
jgi:DNA-binding transcriptional LysR family regulator